MNAAAVEPLLYVSDLSVTFANDAGGRSAVVTTSFEIAAGETVGLAGPSGSGKTLTALAIMGLLPRGAIATGQARWRGQDLLAMPPAALRKLRGREIALVPQDPMSALHPFMRIDHQVAEAVLAHRPGLSRDAALQTATGLLEQTGIPRSRITSSSYPFQWSGGMRQRALIAMAIAHRPALLIADEPTTALDVTTQAEILRLLKNMLQETGSSMLLISHDANVVRSLASRIITVGRHASVRASRQAPRAPLKRADAELLSVRNLSVQYNAEAGWFGRARTAIRAVEDVSFQAAPGETLAIVGESGCGKSTLARALVGLERPSAGTIILMGRDIARIPRDELRTLRRSIQIVFQDPFSSLNPRRTVGESIAEPLRIHGLYGEDGPGRVAELIDRVRLPAEYARRYPRELSGGECQRVAIARALALEPSLLVLDEPVTSLDAETRADILQLLQDLQQERATALLLIAHDLRLVRAVAHSVAVMLDGRFVEVGEAHDVFERPIHPYTRRLLEESIP